jgi:YidC/Oxa1 family membrane protein insertase
MDRTSRIGLFICIFGFFALQFAMEKYYPTPPPKPKPAVKSTPPSLTAPAVTPGAPSTEVTDKNQFQAEVEVMSVLENPAIKVTLTSKNASIEDIELKQHQDGGGHIVLNDHAHSNILELDGWPGAGGWQVAKSSDQEVDYTTTLPGGVKWQRSYTFGPEQDSETGFAGLLRKISHKIAESVGQAKAVPLVYTLDVKDTLTNTGTADATLPAYSLSVGRAQPLLVRKHYQTASDQYLGSGWFTQKFHLTTVSAFNPSSFLFFTTSAGKDLISSTTIDDQPLRWLGVENQFFTVLLTPQKEHLIQHANIQCFNQRDADGYIISTRDPAARDPEGYLLPGLEPDIEAAAFFPAITVPAGQTISLDYNIYAGPKEYDRLDALGDNQGELMNYGMFAILIVPMLAILHFWYLIFKSYGVAIILLTLMIKAITWPLQSIANHSGKRMQAIAPKLKELQAKYKDQPEKLQTETFAMYKKYKVNPFGGCLPALVQMPVFFSLYFMLINAVELRGQSFLWVHDLTQPDSVVTFALPFVLPWIGGHFSLNLLPIIVTALMAIMMRMTPQIGDPTQAKVAQFMPLIFLVIFYNFAAALSLYYVFNNAVSIIQIYRNLKKPMPPLTER